MKKQSMCNFLIISMFCRVGMGKCSEGKSNNFLHSKKPEIFSLKKKAFFACSFTKTLYICGANNFSFRRF